MYNNNCYIFHVHFIIYIQQWDLLLIAILDIGRCWNIHGCKTFTVFHYSLYIRLFKKWEDICYLEDYSMIEISKNYE